MLLTDGSVGLTLAGGPGTLPVIESTSPFLSVLPELPLAIVAL